MKLLRWIPSHNKNRLVIAAGYPSGSFDTVIEHDKPPKQEPPLDYNDIFLACSRLMYLLSTRRIKGDMISVIYRDDRLFEIRDDSTGQVYVGINAYCGVEKSLFSMPYSLAIILSKFVQTDDAKEKIVIIMTYEDTVFDAFQGIPLERLSTMPKATILLLLNEKGILKEKVLNGESQDAWMCHTD